MYHTLNGEEIGWQISARSSTESAQLRFYARTGAGVYTEVIAFNHSGGASIGGNTVIHAGNYNTYAPTKTGTGASGTWPISITGTAMPASAEAITPTAGTGFTLSNVAAYRVGNIVLLHFTAYGSYSGNGSSTVASISTAYRPLKMTRSPAVLYGRTDAYSIVSTSGNVTVTNSGAQFTSTAYVSIIYAI